MLKKIGIMGGSFDPIHYGHLAAANEILYKLKLSKIYFVPAKQNPFKKNSLSNKHRLNMVKIACSTNPNFKVLALDINRAGSITKTLDTLKDIKKIEQNSKLYFIVGADSIKTIDKWYKPLEIVKLAKLIAVSRPNFPIENKDYLEKTYKIKFMNIPAMEISSSDLRKRVKNKIPIGYLTPQRIIKYIYKNNLYK